MGELITDIIAYLIVFLLMVGIPGFILNLFLLKVVIHKDYPIHGIWGLVLLIPFGAFVYTHMEERRLKKKKAVEKEHNEWEF